jgi:hypothetical protein
MYGLPKIPRNYDVKITEIWAGARATGKINKCKVTTGDNGSVEVILQLQENKHLD